MSYDGSNLSAGVDLIGGAHRSFVYKSADTFIGTVDQSAFFSDGYSRGMRVGDLVICEKTTDGTLVLTYCSVANATTKACTVVALAYAGPGSFTTLASSGSTTLGDAAADTIGFYGATAVSQRASSVQATSNYASSTDFGATQLAWQVEVGNTFKGLGLWKGAA